MPFELQIALRYLLAKRRQVFISVITLVSTLGVTVGVMALVIALAIMTGLQQELQDRLLGAMSHVTIWKPAGIEDYRSEVERVTQVTGIIAAAPAIYGKALVTTERGEAFITFKGVDPAMEMRVNEVASRMTGGSLDDVTIESEDDPPGIVIGHDVATMLGAFVGDRVRLTTAQGSLTPFGMAPRTLTMRVVGTFRLGLVEFDSQYAFVSIPMAERLTGKTQVDHLEARVANIYEAPDIADRISEVLGSSYIASDWTDINQTLYSALYLEKIAMGLGIGLIVGVAALNIVASLILLVMEKTRDIAILKTMGASARSVMLIFLVQGVVIGTVGTLLGATLGASIAFLLDRYRVISIPGDVYQVTYLPFRVLPWDLVAIVVGGFVICLLATLYPSRQAARLDPAQALRYE